MVGEAAVAVADNPANCAGATATTMEAVRAAAGAVTPTQEQTTGLAALQVPPALDPTETKLVPAGNGNVMVTSCASDGPALVKVARYVKLEPAVTGSGVPARVIDRSLSADNVVVSVALLLPGVGSVTPPPTVAVAVLLSVPVALAAMVALTE